MSYYPYFPNLYFPLAANLSPDFPDVANVLESDTVNGVAGTYHEAATSEVKDGVKFGAASALTGTYGAASSSLSGVALIRAMLESKLNVLSPALATAWENAPYTPIVGTAYQRVYLLIATPENPTFGSGFHREKGIFQINLFYPIQAGTATATARAESIKTLFKRGLSITNSGVTVIIDATPEISQGARDEDRWFISVKIRWHADIYE